MKSFNSRPAVKQIRDINCRINAKLKSLESQIGSQEKLITHIENRHSDHAVACDSAAALSDCQKLRERCTEIRDLRIRSLARVLGPSHNSPSMDPWDTANRRHAAQTAIEALSVRLKNIARRLSAGWRIGCELPSRTEMAILSRECARLVLRLAEAGLVKHVQPSTVGNRNSLYWPDVADDAVAKSDHTHVEYYEVKSAPLGAFLWRVIHCDGAQAQARIHDQVAAEKAEIIEEEIQHMLYTNADRETLLNINCRLAEKKRRHAASLLLRSYSLMSEFVDTHGMDPATSKFEHLSHFDTVKEHDLSDLQRTPDHSGLLARFPSFGNAVAKHPTLFGHDSEWDKPVYFQGGAARWFEPSEIESRLFGGVYFITGDSVCEMPGTRMVKAYTVRKVVKTGVDQIGGYRCFSDIDTAVDFISQCLGRSPHHCRVCCAEGVRSTPDTAACRACKGTGIETIS